MGINLKKFLLFVLLGISLFYFNSCSNQKDYGSKKVHTVRHKDIKHNYPSTNADISAFQAPDFSTIRSISIISPTKSFVVTPKSIYFLNGKKFNLIYSLKSNVEFWKVSCNDKFIAFSVIHPFFVDFLLPNLTLLNLTKEGNSYRIAKVLKCNIPFSNMINSINFLDTNKLILTGFSEYGIFDLDAFEKTRNILKSFKHYSLNPPTPIQFINNNFSLNKNIISYFGGDMIFYCNIKDKSPKLKMLIKANQLLGIQNNYNQIKNICLTDTNFGNFIFANDTGYYFYRNNLKNIKLLKFLYLNLTSGGLIYNRDILKIITFSKNNIWAVTAHGEILHQLPSNDLWNKRKWEVVSNLNIYTYSDVFTSDSTSIYIAASSLIKLKLLYNSDKITNPKSQMSKPEIFQGRVMQENGTIYGAGVGDFSNNGNEGIYLVSLYGANQMYLNLNTRNDFLSSDESAAQRGITGRKEIKNISNIDLSAEIGVAVGDLTESGSEDIYVTVLAGDNLFYKNNGKGYFKNVTKGYSLDSDIGRSECAVLSDVDNNGYLDIFTTSYLSSNRLFMNYFGNKFYDRSRNAHLISNGASICAAFADINNDGYPDLYVGNWMRENKLYLNNRDGTFTDITKSSGTGCGNLKATNSVLFADFNNDGKLDLFVGNRGGGNKLFLNEGNGKFKDVSKDVGLDDSLPTYGAAFGDFDNDGYLDLFISYLGGFKIYRNMMGQNGGKLLFKDVTNSFIGESQNYDNYNTCLATLDYDKDGDLDVFAGQNGGRSFLFENILNEHRLKSIDFLEVKVVGSQSNRDAVGAKLQLFRNDSLIAFREVESGYGYASSSSKIQHFGLGDGKGNYKLRVYFPASGIVKKISIIPNSIITVHEYEGLAENYFIVKKNILRFLLSSKFLIWSAKLILLYLLISVISNLNFFNNDYENSKNIFRFFKSNLPNLLTILMLVFYIVAKLLIFYSQNFTMSSYYYISNSRNVFLEDILPFFLIILFEIFYLVRRKNIDLLKLSSSNTLENIWLILRRFEHGEGMLMNLNRLSLFIKNISYGLRNNNSPDIEMLQRVKEIMDEYKISVLPELKNVSALLLNIPGNKLNVLSKDNRKNLSYIISNSGTKLLQMGENLIGLFEKSKDISTQIDIDKSSAEWESNFHSLKNEISFLREEVKKFFRADINNSIKIISNKFKSTSDYVIIIDNYCSYNNSYAFISFSELCEILTIIIQNAIEELTSIEKKEGIIKITLKENSAKITITIEDNGNGISPDLIKQIFENNFSTKKGKHGFGLKFVKKCIEKYEGKIEANQSELGGAKFIIELNKNLP